MEKMDKGLTVPEWVLINQPKIPQMTQNLSAQIVCPSPKVCDFNEKKHHWSSVIRVPNHGHISRVFSDSDVTKCAVCSNVQVVVNTKFKTKCSDDDTIILIIFSIPTPYQFFKFQALHMSQNGSYYYYMKQI